MPLSTRVTPLQRWMYDYEVSVSELARRAGISENAVRRILDHKTRTRVDIAVLDALAETTGLDYNDLLSTTSSVLNRRSGWPVVDHMITEVLCGMYRKDCVTEHRKYIHQNFRCYSPVYADKRVYDYDTPSWVTWEEMCKANQDIIRGGGGDQLTLQSSDHHTYIYSIDHLRIPNATASSNPHLNGAAINRMENNIYQGNTFAVVAGGDIGERRQWRNPDRGLILLTLEIAPEDIPAGSNPRITDWWWIPLDITEEVRIATAAYERKQRRAQAQSRNKEKVKGWATY